MRVIFRPASSYLYIYIFTDTVTLRGLSGFLYLRLPIGWLARGEMVLRKSLTTAAGAFGSNSVLVRRPVSEVNNNNNKQRFPVVDSNRDGFVSAEWPSRIVRGTISGDKTATRPTDVDVQRIFVSSLGIYF